MPLRTMPRLGTQWQKPSPVQALPFCDDLATALDPTLLMVRAGLDQPEPWQRALLSSTAKRLAVLCPRQSGKSTTTAVVALHHALYHNSAVVLVVSPSKRQSDLLFEKIVDILDALEFEAVDFDRAFVFTGRRRGRDENQTKNGAACAHGWHNQAQWSSVPAPARTC